MKKSELKSFIREEIISTLSEDLDELEDQLDVVDQKLDAVISKKEEAGVNEQVDKFNVDVFGYKTKYYKVCPGAKAFMDKVMDGAYGDMSQKQNEVIRIAKLHDLLFIRELKALKDSNYADQVIPQVEYIAEEIKDNVQLLGMPIADVGYLDNHIEIIKDAGKKVNESISLSEPNEDMEKLISRGIKRIRGASSSDEEDILYYVHNNWMGGDISAEEAMKKISKYLDPR